jgi:hypothetical protein
MAAIQSGFGVEVKISALKFLGVDGCESKSSASSIMKTIIMLGVFAAVMAAIGLSVSHPGELARNPTPTPTPSQDMPQAHFKQLLPPGGEEGAMERYAASRPTPKPTATPWEWPHLHLNKSIDESDPEMIAALEAGQLTTFEIKNGHPPVKWPDGDGIYAIR